METTETQVRVAVKAAINEHDGEALVALIMGMEKRLAGLERSTAEEHAALHGLADDYCPKR